MTTAVVQMTRTQDAQPSPTVATTTACVFLMILFLLASQLRAGHDPGLGRGAPVAAKQAPAPGARPQRRLRS